MKGKSKVYVLTNKLTGASFVMPVASDYKTFRKIVSKEFKIKRIEVDKYE